MKKLKILIVLGVSQLIFSQTGKVGIGTTQPTHTLDINGNTRIRAIDSITTTPKYVLTSGEDGTIQKVNADKLSTSNPEVTRRKIYAVLSKNAPQLLTTKGTDYSLIYDGTINGINTENLTLNTEKNRINLPPDKTFKITGYIGILGSSASGTGSTTPGYVTSLFAAGGNAEAIVSTLGYTESSTEGFDDGGVTPPIIIVTTGASDNNYVELKVRYGGTSSGNDGYYISGAATRTSLGTYILLEEL